MFWRIYCFKTLIWFYDLQYSLFPNNGGGYYNLLLLFKFDIYYIKNCVHKASLTCNLDTCVYSLASPNYVIQPEDTDCLSLYC